VSSERKVEQIGRAVTSKGKLRAAFYKAVIIGEEIMMSVVNMIAPRPIQVSVGGDVQQSDVAQEGSDDVKGIVTSRICRGARNKRTRRRGYR
jgi:hypothetical protein